MQQKSIYLQRFSMRIIDRQVQPIKFTKSSKGQLPIATPTINANNSNHRLLNLHQFCTHELIILFHICACDIRLNFLKIYIFLICCNTIPLLYFIFLYFWKVLHFRCLYFKMPAATLLQSWLASTAAFYSNFLRWTRKFSFQT